MTWNPSIKSAQRHALGGLAIVLLPLAAVGLNQVLFSVRYTGTFKMLLEGILVLTMITSPLLALATIIVALVFLTLALRRRSRCLLLPFATWTAAAAFFTATFISFNNFLNAIGSLGGK